MKVPSRALLLASLCVLLVCLRTTRAACDTIANCDDCAGDKCSKCATGFTLSTDGTACSAAVASNCEVSRCETCEDGDPTKCNTCGCGHVLSPSKDMCTACRVRFCESCVSPGYGNQCQSCRKNYKMEDGGTRCVYAKPGLEWWWIFFIVFVIVLVGLLTAYLVYTFFFRVAAGYWAREKLSVIEDNMASRSSYHSGAAEELDNNTTDRIGSLRVDDDVDFDAALPISSISNPLNSNLNEDSRRVNDISPGVSIHGSVGSRGSRARLGSQLTPQTEGES